MNYDPDCLIVEEEQFMESYMEKIRDEVIESLSPMQIAAMFQDFKEFCFRWREEEDIKRAENYYD